MDMRRMTIWLLEEDAKALQALADYEYRHPSMQAGILLREAVRQELKRLGLLDQPATAQRQGEEAQRCQNGQ